MTLRSTLKNYLTSLLCAAAALTAGCDSSHDDGEGSDARPVLAAFNGVSDMQAITFLREEEEWSALEFGSGTDFRSVDADQYDLNFDAILPGDETASCTGDNDGDDVKDDDECTRLNSTSVNVVSGHDYVVALLGHFASLRVQVYDKPTHTFDASTDDGDAADENMEVQFFHFSDTLGDVDVYLEPPGTNLSPVQARTVLSLGQEFHGLVDKGDYVLTFTPVGNPAAPLFTSEQFSLTQRTKVAFAIRDGAGDGTAAIKISRFRDQGGVLLDRRAKTELRLAHVAPGAGNVDVFAEGDYAQPLFANAALETTSAYREIDPTFVTNLDLDVTPAGNPGVLLAREQMDLAKGERATMLLLLDSTRRLDALRLQDNFRRIATYAQVRLVNAASSTLDFYVVKTGSNINSLNPTTTLSAGTALGLQTLDPERYDIVLTRSGSDSPVFGPIAVDLAGGGIYTVVATPASEATSAGAVLLDDFVP